MIHGILALALNIVAFFYLRSWRPLVALAASVAMFVKSIQLSRQIKAYRAAGLLVILFAVSLAHAQYQVWEDQNKCPGCVGVSGVGGGERHEVTKEVVRRYEEAKRHVFLDQPRTENHWTWLDDTGKCKMGCINTAVYVDGKYEVTWYDAMTFSFTAPVPAKVISNVGYSDGDAMLAKHYQQKYTERYSGDITGVDWIDASIRYVWKHAGMLFASSLLIFFLFGFKSESTTADVQKLSRRGVRLGETKYRNYHGDDAFVVPDGMHSEYESVPVRNA